MTDTYYNQDYFEWQKKYGALTAKFDAFKFTPHVNATDHVLDFGCGGGYLLKTLSCAHKYGVEINPTARQQAAANGLTVYATLDEVPANSIDIIISHHALEHVHDPLGDVQQLYSLLNNNGRLILVVPHDCVHVAYDPADINQHLYTWNAQTLGNLVKLAGFQEVQVEAIQHEWRYKFDTLYRISPRLFHLAAGIFARVRRTYQFKVVAFKQAAP